MIQAVRKEVGLIMCMGRFEFPRQVVSLPSAGPAAVGGSRRK